MKYLLIVYALVLSAMSCSTLHSTTFIKPKDIFILGNNKHGSFNVELKNSSKNDIEVHQAPIDGGQHSFLTIKPEEKVHLKVDTNTALLIQNNSADTASVNLKVKGDTGLSMGYKN